MQNMPREKIYVGAGVNVKVNNQYERYTSTYSIDEAIQIAYVLNRPKELKLWDGVEVEAIYALQNGDFEYETVLELS